MKYQSLKHLKAIYLSCLFKIARGLSKVMVFGVCTIALQVTIDKIMEFQVVETM